MVDLNSCVDFLQRLIRTRSLSGSEGQVAALVKQEMERLGFDQVQVDEAGNVIGLIRGQGQAPAVMLNTHLDHVDVGEVSAWPYPPYGGEIHDGKVWGRGAVDIKGPLAAQVYGAAALLEEEGRPPGDVYVTAVVQEEVGGLGARHLARNFPPGLVVVGEPSRNGLRIGHRGRVEAVIRVQGRSAHASMPEQGVNPLLVAGCILGRLSGLELSRDPLLGSSSVTPTLLRTDQTSPNVIPGKVWLTCDWRSVPGETFQSIREQLQTLAEECLMEGAEVTVEIPVLQRESFTPLKMELPAAHPPFTIPANHPAVGAARQVLSEVLGGPVEAGIWRFATDAGHFAEAGFTAVGFGPGDDTLAHTVREAVGIGELEQGMRAYHVLARDWGAALDREGR